MDKSDKRGGIYRVIQEISVAESSEGEEDYRSAPPCDDGLPLQGTLWGN